MWKLSVSAMSITLMAKLILGRNNSRVLPAFQDYREMLAKLDDKIDVVSISTPDHTHYPATMDAMEEGKHIYLQKPLTHKLKEARQLAEFAAKKGTDHPDGDSKPIT
jgi:predicted dehydrogenase